MGIELYFLGSPACNLVTILTAEPVQNFNLYTLKYSIWTSGRDEMMSYSYCFSSELWMRFLFAFTGIRSCWICFMKKQDIIFWKADTHVKYLIISCWEAFKLELNWVHIIPKFTPFSSLGILSCNYFGYLCAYMRRMTSCSDHPAVLQHTVWCF